MPSFLQLQFGEICSSTPSNLSMYLLVPGWIFTGLHVIMEAHFFGWRLASSSAFFGGSSSCWWPFRTERRARYNSKAFCEDKLAGGLYAVRR